ncbi:MAG: glycerophosphodiester phosphodiesterase family protein [Pseudomonadota bacterium]
MIHRPNVTDPGRVIAHRGASRVAPENTLSAFRAAAAQGVWWVEFDVSLLGDGTPVVHHDGTLERCTGRRGPLTDIAAADLSDLSAGIRHGDQFRNGPLPTLEQVLDVLEELHLYANLEMKPHDVPTGAIAAKVVEALATRPWARERIITSSFGHAELAAYRASAPNAPVAVLFEKPPRNWRVVVDQMQAAAVHLNFVHLSESLLREASSFGIDTRVYTINQPELMEPFREHGLTSVITDHPPLFLELDDWARWAKE